MKKTNLLSIQKFFYIIYVFVMLFGLTVVCDTNFSSEKSEAASGTWLDYGNFSTIWLLSGEGSESDPYLISSAEDLAGLAYLVNISGNNYSGKYFEQTCNISLSAHYWIPIGGGQYGMDKWFAGNYNGCGYNISGLYISQSSHVCVGLFGIVKGGIIGGINVTSGTINGNGDTAAIVGYTEGGMTIVRYCSNAASVYGTWRVGGIVGGYQNKWNGGLRIYDCYNKGYVRGNVMVGGILGGQNNNGQYGTIRFCYSTGTIYGDGAGNDNKSLVGGIVGRLAGADGKSSQSGYAMNTWSTSPVSKNTYVGGIAGEFFYCDTSILQYGKNYFNNISDRWGDGHNPDKNWTTYLGDLSTKAKDINWYKTTSNWCTYVGTWDMTSVWQIVGNNYPTFRTETLTLNANGGSVSADYFNGSGSTVTRYRTYASYYGKLPTPTRTGYTFDGWYTAKTGGSKITSTNVYGSGNRTLYAHWTPNTYTVSYTLNSGSDGTYHPTSWTYNTAQQISNPTRTGHAFTGWTASSLSTSTAVYGTSSSPTTKWSNANTKVKASSATGALYFKNLRTTSGTVTLKANWEIEIYKFQYNYDGTAEQVEGIQYNTQYTFPTVTKSGYTLTGWKCQANGVTYKPNTTYTVPDLGDNGDTIQFNAVWQVNTYTVTFDDQGGVTNYADMIDVSAASYSNGVYQFTQGGVTGKYELQDKTLTLNGTVTSSFTIFLSKEYTMVEGDKYQIDYTYISGDPGTQRCGCMVVDICDANGNNMTTRQYLNFAEPLCTNGTKTETITVNSDGAKGKGIKIWFWYNSDAGTRTFENYKIQLSVKKVTGNTLNKKGSFVYDSIMRAVSIPTKYGYNFQGYYTEPKTDDEKKYTQYFDSNGCPVFTNMNIAENTTLYAHWTPRTDLEITIDLAGGKYSGQTKLTNQQYRSLLGLSVPEKEGYVFDGWEITKGEGEVHLAQYYLDEKTFNGNNYQAIGREYMYTDLLTISLWAYMDDWSEFNTKTMRLLSCAEGGGWDFEPTVKKGYLNFEVYNKGVGYSEPFARSTKLLSEFEQGWHHIVVTFNGSYVDMYIDGEVQEQSTLITSGEIGYNANNAIFIGAEALGNQTTPDSSKPFFNGKMKGLTFYHNYVTTVAAVEWNIENDDAGIYTLIPYDDLTITAKWTPIGEEIAKEPTKENVTIEGTPKSAYLIQNAEDLIWLAQNPGEASYAIQTNHISLNGVKWSGIGNTTTPFEGYYDGQGYTISGLTQIGGIVNKNGEKLAYDVGLFGVTLNATIKNIYLEGVKLTGLNRVGGIVGNASGTTTVSSCAIIGSLTAFNDNKGGVIGYSTAEEKCIVQDCLIDYDEQEINIAITNITVIDSIKYSRGTASGSTGFVGTNWVDVIGMKYTKLPKGLAWIASGK